jgi:cellulose synthase/poly-beta-1,6-N-acetylglucosamine synthase-like glycosyltransferase
MPYFTMIFFFRKIDLEIFATISFKKNFLTNVEICFSILGNNEIGIDLEVVRILFGFFDDADATKLSS